MTALAVETRYFGDGADRLFGSLHRAADGVRADLALVVCNPFGFEEVCVHRSLRDVAQTAAAAGIATLRFDLAGCGHSAGDDAAEMTSRWVWSVHRAIDTARRATGATRVCLLGVRLGALLAAVAAAERDDVHGLLLVAPVTQGRAYLRELRVLGNTGAMHARPTDDRTLESAGFSLSAATCETLSRLDLKALARAPAPHVLVVERDDLPGVGDLASVLERLGARASVRHWPGYAAMAEDPQRAVTPQAIVEGVLATLRDWRCDATPALAGVADWGERSLTGAPGWIETPVHIDSGAGTTLFGVMCRPRGDVAGEGGAPAMLMLNAGSVHAIGPNRLWVRLSRRWASRGVRSLRLDLAGIGDSPARPGAADNVVYSPHAMADVTAALAYLREHEGADAFHVMGLCSGAYHAFKAATTGLAVSSALMINPLTYFWAPGTPLAGVKDYELIELGARYRAELFGWEPWRRLLKADLDLRLIAAVAWRSALRNLRLRMRGLARWLHLPLKDDLARELRQAADAAVPLRFVFAADAPGFTLLLQQSGTALSNLLRGGQVSIEFVDDADHTFTRAEARERLVQVLDRSVTVACGLAAPI